MIRSARFLILILILTALFGACGESSRVRRVTRVEYLPLPKDAPVEVLTSPEKRVYDRIAIVDSNHYVLPDYYPRSHNAIEQARHKAAAEQHEKMFEKMREDLRVTAREQGGDCVQNVRKMRMQVRGILPDPSAPMPGLKTQGDHDEYFLRGEVIKLTPRQGKAAASKAGALAPAGDADTATSATATQPMPVPPEPPTLENENTGAVNENTAPETPADAPQEETPPSSGQDSQSK